MILLYFIFLIYVFHLFLVPSFLHVAPIAVPIITENSSVTSSVPLPSLHPKPLPAFLFVAH